MKDDRVYLAHIRDALTRIAEYTTEGREQFFADSRTQDPVVRNLEIVGEAAKRLSERAKGSAGDVSWRAIGAMRDKLIHEYFGTDLEIVWRVVERDVPPLRKAVSTLLGANAVR